MRCESDSHRERHATHRRDRSLMALSLSGCSYNKFTHAGRGDQGAVGRGAESAAAAQRPDPEPRRNGERLRGARVRRLQRDRRRRVRKLLAAKSPEETIQAANQQTSALGRLLAVVENYPNLKADAQFMRLQDELSGTENRLASRADALQRVGAGLQHAAPQFPSNVTAKVFGFKEYPYWEVPPEARQAPKVDFGK